METKEEVEIELHQIDAGKSIRHEAMSPQSRISSGMVTIQNGSFKPTHPVACLQLDK